MPLEEKTGFGQCHSSCLDGSQLETAVCAAYTKKIQPTEANAEIETEHESTNNTRHSLSGGRAALIIDWRRCRRPDETVEESLRIGAFNLHPAINGTRRQLPTFLETSTCHNFKYTGSASKSPSLALMESIHVDSDQSSNNSPLKKQRHVTFSEPEISQVLITHDIVESIPLDDYDRPKWIASVEKPLIVKRIYLANVDLLKQLHNSDACYCLDDRTENWSEQYYDTPASSLCSLECILMKDTRAPKYWKFYSFAEENEMEITTDEKEINEPLSRLMPADEKRNGPKNHRRLIDCDSLKPFMDVRHERGTFLYSDHGCLLKSTMTDYGFAWVSVERFCVNGERLIDVNMEIEEVAAKLGLSNMANYDPDRYL